MLSVILSVLSGGTGIKTLVLSKKPPLKCVEYCFHFDIIDILLQHTTYSLQQRAKSKEQSVNKSSRGPQSTVEMTFSSFVRADAICSKRDTDMSRGRSAKLFL
jgi:hypothetical protein